MVERDDQFSAQLFAVIVLYKMHPSESVAYRTLLSAVRNSQPLQNGIEILLYDNTPGGCDPGPLPKGVRYEASEQNGVAVAYNRALAFARNSKFKWLLILDQDTNLPDEYLPQMSKLARDFDGNMKIAAIVPQMVDKGRLIAPVFIRSWGVSYLPLGFVGTSQREIHSTNSASIFRVSALSQIGGFNPYFWLDYADGYIFRQLHLHGMKVYVAGDLLVEHQLSLLNGGQLNPERFRNILRAESAFWDLYGGRIQGLALTARLLGRIWRQRRRGHDSAIRTLTWNELKRRVFCSKTHRIIEWRNDIERLLPGLADLTESQRIAEGRPAISVCLAAYNGERFICEQLQSILGQLEPEDEVIVVDDASEDETKNRVLSINDKRIRLIEHARNQGISRSFEDAILAATGEIIFLSDQDDLWTADKVAIVLREFQSNPKADIAVTDAELIAENGALLGPSYYARRGKFRSEVLANIFRCSYLGCTMAFRSRIRARILPFPNDASVLHDLWIGASTTFCGGKTLYIDRPLVHYRRHLANATGNKRLSLARQIRMRWDLCKSLFELWLNPRY